MKTHIKRGDVVKAIAGSQRGKQGKVLQLLPKKNRAVVEGLALIKRHTRKSQDHPHGAIVEREGSIHISNLQRIEAAETDRKADKGSKKEEKES